MNHAKLLSEAFRALDNQKIKRNDFTIKCNNCDEVMTFVNLGGTWAGKLRFKNKNDEIQLNCKCGNEIRIA